MLRIVLGMHQMEYFYCEVESYKLLLHYCSVWVLRVASVTHDPYSRG